MLGHRSGLCMVAVSFVSVGSVVVVVRGCFRAGILTMGGSLGFDAVVVVFSAAHYSGNNNMVTIQRITIYALRKHPTICPRPNCHTHLRLPPPSPCASPSPCSIPSLLWLPVRQWSHQRSIRSGFVPECFGQYASSYSMAIRQEEEKRGRYRVCIWLGVPESVLD